MPTSSRHIEFDRPDVIIKAVEAMLKGARYLGQCLPHKPPGQ